MKSCIYNGEVKYIWEFKDFQECMDLSVFNALEEVLTHMVSKAYNDGYERGMNAFDPLDDEYEEDTVTDLEIEKESLLDEISSLEDKTLAIEAEKTEILETIDNALSEFFNTKDIDELVCTLENLL